MCYLYPPKNRNAYAQFFCLKRLINCTPTVGQGPVFYVLQIASYIHHSGKLTPPLSLLPFIPPTPPPLPLPLLVLEDTDVTRCR